MKSSHLYGFTAATLLASVFLLGMNIVSIRLLGSIVIGVSILGILSYSVHRWVSLPDIGSSSQDPFSTTSKNPGAGSHYDTAIEPDQAWKFVNDRIDDVESAPYRKIDTDTSNLRKNDATGQGTIRATIDGEETRITMIKGKPLNPRKGEVIAYIIDLAKPSIHDWKGGLRSEEEKRNPFNGKYGFYISKGRHDREDSSPKNDSSGSPLVEVNEGGKKEDESTP